MKKMIPGYRTLGRLALSLIVFLMMLTGCLALAKDVNMNFDFGALKLDPSKVKGRPTEVMESTPESPAPEVLKRDKDNNVDLGDEMKVPQVDVTPTGGPSSGGIEVRKLPADIQAKDRVIRVKIAAGSEKSDWLSWAAQRFEENPALGTYNGKPVDIIIDSVGSIKSGNEIARGELNADGRNDYQIWAPASSIFRNLVEAKYKGRIFASDDPLVHSPLVFVTLKKVQELIDQRVQKSMSFDTLNEVFVKEYEGQSFNPTGGYFQFGFTRPDSSNSGAMALITMAYEFFAPQRPRYQISLEDLKEPKFQAYLAYLKALADQTFTSTNKLGDAFGNGTYRLLSVYVYENVALKQIDRARSRGDAEIMVLRYPKYNTVANHPYYTVIHGNTQEQIDVALRFRDFLLELPQQLYAMEEEGFRPVNEQVTREQLNQAFAGYVRENGLIPDIRKASQVLIPSQQGEVVKALIEMYGKLDVPSGI